MSPTNFKSPLSPRDVIDTDRAYFSGGVELSDQKTPRYIGGLGKNAYALAFGGSDLSKILLFNSGNKPLSPLDGLMKKSMNPEESSLAAKLAMLKMQSGTTQGTGDVVVPRDFMIKTAYVKKRRNTTLNGNQSVRSNQSSAISVFTKPSQTPAAQNSS